MIQEKEQQAALALEELELQKVAIQSQNENRVQELQQELETFSTVSVLEESSGRLLVTNYSEFVIHSPTVRCSRNVLADFIGVKVLTFV